jgi:hypothetical protein
MAKGPESHFSISKPKLILVEGKDELLFFSSMIKWIGLESEIDIGQTGGKNNLPSALKALKIAPGRHGLTSVGIVRDADNNAASAFRSVCSALRNADWPVPIKPLETAGEPTKVTVMVLPVGEQTGMLEDVFLKSVADDPAMICVDQYFQCLAACLEVLPNNPAKAIVRSFLVSREVLEEAHFEYLRENLEAWAPGMPAAPSAQKVHAFLASKYKPTLALGQSISAGKGGEDYWPFDHPAFDEIKDFLRSL